MELSEEEKQTVECLIADWGFEYSLSAKREKVAELARKLGRDDLAKNVEG